MPDSPDDPGCPIMSLEYGISADRIEDEKGAVYDSIVAAGEPHDTFEIEASEGDTPSYEDYEQAFKDWAKENEEWLKQQKEGEPSK